MTDPRCILGDDTGYTYICTAGKRGCLERHGGEEKLVGHGRALEFKHCPNCEKYERANYVKVVHGKDRYYH